MKHDPIGVFDSGMGGLTVLSEIMDLLPGEHTLYYSDGAHCPYGPRSPREVTELTIAAVRFLLERGAKLVVVACNTATAAAIDTLRATFPDLPFVGMEPAVKPAVLSTRTGVVGILATRGTFRGRLFNAAYRRFRDRATIIPCIGDGLVELVEEDREDTPQARELVERYVEPLLARGADRIVLGCTHYPFLAPRIREVIGDREVAVVNPAPAVARRVRDLLAASGELNDSGAEAVRRFYSSGGEDRTAFLERKLRAYRDGVAG